MVGGSRGLSIYDTLCWEGRVREDRSDFGSRIY